VPTAEEMSYIKCDDNDDMKRKTDDTMGADVGGSIGEGSFERNMQLFKEKTIKMSLDRASARDYGIVIHISSPWNGLTIAARGTTMAATLGIVFKQAISSIRTLSEKIVQDVFTGRRHPEPAAVTIFDKNNDSSMEVMFYHDELKRLREQEQKAGNLRAPDRGHRNDRSDATKIQMEPADPNQNDKDNSKGQPSSKTEPNKYWYSTYRRNVISDADSTDYKKMAGVVIIVIYILSMLVTTMMFNPYNGITGYPLAAWSMPMQLISKVTLTGWRKDYGDSLIKQAMNALGVGAEKSFTMMIGGHFINLLCHTAVIVATTTLLTE